MYEPSVNINLCVWRLENGVVVEWRGGGGGTVKHFSKYKAEMAINNRWASFSEAGKELKKAPTCLQ